MFEKMMDVIRNNTDELSKRVVKDLLSRNETSSFKKISGELLYERTKDVYHRLDQWISKKKTTEDMRKVFEELGSIRFHEGVPLSETILALELTKRHLWLMILEKHVLDSAFELIHGLELNNKVVLFFDRAIYFAAKGFEEALKKEVQSHGDGGFFAKIFKK